MKTRNSGLNQKAKLSTGDLADDDKRELFRTLVRAMALDRMMMRIIRAGRMVGFYHEGGMALAPGVAAGRTIGPTA